MEIDSRKFNIYTILFIIAMLVVILVFGRAHPMGADFSRFRLVDHSHLDNPQQLSGQRIAIRGRIFAVNPADLIKAGKTGDIVGYIEKRFERTAGWGGRVQYLSFKTADFYIDCNGKRLKALGQPEQIIDPANRISSVNNPDQYLETIRNGGQYSVFGTITRISPDEFVLIPYRVTNLEIADVAEAAKADNKRILFTQLFTISVLLLVYGIALFRGGVIKKCDKTACRCGEDGDQCACACQCLKTDSPTTDENGGGEKDE